MSELWNSVANVQIATALVMIVVLLMFIAFKVSDRSPKPRHHK